MATSNHIFVKQFIKGRNILHQNPENRSSKKKEFLKCWILDFVPFFKMFSSESLDILLENMTLETYKAREIVFQQEDFNMNFYIVLRGNLSALVDTSSLQRMFYSSNDNEKRAFQGFNGLPLSHLRALSKKERITTIRHAHSNEVWRMSTGDYFGEDSLIMREGKTLYSVRSLDHVELLVIDGSDFDEVLKPYFHQVFFERIKLLYSMGLFHNCSIMSVRLLVHMLRESNYHLGECLFRQNMKCDSISIIAEGSVKLSSDSCQKTPPDLLEKIRPPKDHLGDILMEGKPKGGAKNMGNSTQHGSRGISKGRHATALSAVTVRSKVSSLSVRSSRKASGSRKKKVDQSDYEMMGFVLHQPSTHSPNVHICTLVQGDILGDIESRAKLTRHLFSAVCVSSTTIYEIKTSVFEAIMHKRLGTMAHQMVERCIQKVEAWQSSHPTIPFFPPLSTVLTQIIGDLEEDGAHKLVRNPPKNETPESLAMACINGLDFKIPDTNSEMSDEDFVPEMNYLSDGDSISSDILSQFGFSSEANMGDAEAKDPDMVVQKSSSERSANSSMEEPTSLAEAAALDADLTYYPPLHETRAMKERKKRLYSFDAAVPFGKHTFNSNKPLSIPSPVHENAYEHFESQGQDRAKLNTNIEQPHHGGPDEYGNRQTGFKDKNADGCGKLSLAKIRYDVKYNKEQSLKKRDSFNLMTTDFVRSGLIRPLHKLIPDLPQASFATRVVPVRIPSGREAERIKGTGSSLSIDAKFEPVNEITQVRSSSKQVRGDCLKDTSATTIRHSSDGSIKVLTLELEMVRKSASSVQTLSASKRKLLLNESIGATQTRATSVSSFVPHPWTILPPKSAPEAFRTGNIGPKLVDQQQESSKSVHFRNSRSCNLVMPISRAPTNTPVPLPGVMSGPVEMS